MRRPGASRPRLGIEFGQLMFVAVAVPAVGLVLRRVPSGRMGIIVLSALIAHTALHWMTERWKVLAKTPWPSPTSSDMMILVRWAAAALAIWGIVRLLAAWKGVRARVDTEDATVRLQPSITSWWSERR